jgi:nitric oxide reductase subunit C
MKREVSRPNLCASLATLATLALVIAGLGAPVTASTGNVANGHKLYTTHGCAACHIIGGKGGKIGPDLSKEGKKRDAKWMSAFLKDPQSKYPKGTMPPTHASHQEIEDLTAYMLSLK